ncbi:NitT/TauT family transport system substrate-binding protein [Nitrobacteraceae bacterium AZCC 1564]
MNLLVSSRIQSSLQSALHDEANFGFRTLGPSGLKPSIMLKRPTTSLPAALFSLIALLCVLCSGLSGAHASTAIRFSLDRPIDGAAAPFVLASVTDLFRAEDLTVTLDSANGSDDAIARVASGASDVALADINALIRYRDKENAQSIKAVFVLYNKAPYAVIARKSRGIKSMADIEGKTIGLVDNDLAAKLWPAVARRNHIDLGKVKAEKINAAVREPMLSAGQLDAVTGLALLSAINLRDRGVPANDLTVLRFADFGCLAYGHALIVNPAFAAKNPEAVKAFLRATMSGVRMTIKSPEHAIDIVMTRMNNGSRDIELERLQASIHDNIITNEVRQNGLGGIETHRFEAAMDQIAEGYTFRKRPSSADIFDESFLPPADDRKIN